MKGLWDKILGKKDIEAIVDEVISDPMMEEIFKESMSVPAPVSELDIASGKELDRLAKAISVERMPFETDEEMRKRIMGEPLKIEDLETTLKKVEFDVTEMKLHKKRRYLSDIEHELEDANYITIFNLIEERGPFFKELILAKFNAETGQRNKLEDFTADLIWRNNSDTFRKLVRRYWNDTDGSVEHQVMLLRDPLAKKEDHMSLDRMKAKSVLKAIQSL